MKRSTDRILTTHAGSLPRPDDLRALLAAPDGQLPADAAFAARVQHAVAEAVRQQTACGLAIVNDGELGKPNFLYYVRERLSGWETRPPQPAAGQGTAGISGRDAREFPAYFAVASGRRQIGAGLGQKQVFCVAPLRYIGQAAVQADIARLRAALQGVPVEEAFMTAVAPGTIEHWLGNAYYPSYEAFLYGLADAMHEEYKAIVDAGFVLQIDDPGLLDGWQMRPELTVAEYRRHAALAVAALNHALRDLPSDRVRYHVCWGSYHGPHKHDIPLRDIVDLILQVRAQAYSIEASNPRHAHEWRVWEEVKLPEGKLLIPGVVGHYSDFIEHPELIAERLVRYARLVGRENVIAGTDCGLGERVGHPTIVWAKFQALAEGARLATQRLW
ncbi:MAG TPA: cobalamin-independent methionine synthase II family protein [Chloroflexota bacterium]|nr:cobalamin-independent methionine synthase II family protein [Chloroflexota bacterium]HZU06545.1 cobalamin-independent methionine synthase II family protein [Chloroflexota bacterium]